MVRAMPRTSRLNLLSVIGLSPFNDRCEPFRCRSISLPTKRRKRYHPGENYLTTRLVNIYISRDRLFDRVGVAGFSRAGVLFKVSACQSVAIRSRITHLERNRVARIEL